MMVSLAGYFVLHWQARVLMYWLRVAILVLAALAFLSFAAGFVHLIGAASAQKAMVLVMLLYIINGYFGIRVNASDAGKV